MRRWHDAHVGLARWASICCRSDAVSPTRLFVEGGNAGRRVGRRRIEQVVEHPPATQHRRGARRIGRNGQDARLREHAATLAIGEFHAAEGGAGHAVDSVVLREPLVQVRVLRVEELEDAAVLADDVLEEQHRLVAHREAQVVVEGGELLAIRSDRLEGAELQPLAAELLDQRRRPRIERACGAPAPRARPACAACRRSASRRSSASGMLAQRKYDRRDASSCSPTGTADVPASPRPGPARCGTGNRARPAVPAARSRAPRRTTRPPSAPAPSRRRRARVPRAPPAGGRRAARRRRCS